MPPGYKRTEVGVIPEDWDVVSLGELGAFMKGKGIKRDDVSHEGVPCIRYGELYTCYDNYVCSPESHIPKSFAATSLPLKTGDLLFAGSGETVEEIGKCVAYLGKEEAYAGGDIVVLRPLKQNSLFLGHLLNHAIVAQQKARYGQGDAVVHISARNLAMIKLPLPSQINEQDVIAQALSDVDGLLGALDALIAKKRAIKQAAMQQLLTGKTRLPGFNEEWETKRLADYMRFLKTGSNSRSELNTDGPVAYLHYGDIHMNDAVRLNSNNTPVPRIASERVRLLDRLQVGDLVFVDASEDLSGVGKSVEIESIPEGGMVAGLHTIGARFDKTILADGFKAYLQFCPEVLNTLKRLAAGTKVLATNRQHIANIEMALPCVKEQTAIAAALSDMDAEIKALEQRRNKTQQIKQGMMQQLLTGRVRLMPQKTQVLEGPEKPSKGKI